MNSFKTEEMAAMISMMGAGVSDTSNASIHNLVEAYFISPVDVDGDESDDDEDKDEGDSEVYISGQNPGC